ncbi:MAG TPA: tripartite tricarboxylate transporter substrate binding protein [Thermodesulfobacteriota bacterium]|nr:tripartite tricarboxylate transporter substrate binding protein [Thermodesulfobacteriota bacterium]
MKRRIAAVAALSAAVIWLLGGFACAAEFPTKPVNLLIGYAAGGSTDLSSRALAAEASKILKQPVICNNQVGAAGTLVLGRVKGEKTDGYTIYNAPTANFCRIPHLQAVPYDPLKDFSFIMQYGMYQYGILVRSDAPWNTFEELIDYAKKNPNKIKYGTSGLGTGQHLAMEYLAMKQGIKWDHVPFPGGAQVVAALLGGHVQVISQTTEWKEQAVAGKFRLLAVPTAQRLKAFPNAPTLMEKGYDFAVHSTLAFMGPAGMPKEAVDKLDKAFAQAMKSNVFLDVMDKFDMPPAYMGSEELTRFVQKDYKDTGELIKTLGIGLYKKQ